MGREANTGPSSEENALSTASLDFVGVSHTIKDLFALPYSVGRPVSVAVHNLGGTLLVDSTPGDEGVVQMFHGSANQSFLGEDSTNEYQENIASSLLAHTGTEPTNESLCAVKNLMAMGRDPESNFAVPPTYEHVSLGLPLPDDYVSQHIPPVPEPKEYLTWKFHNMNILVGSSALIYRSPETAAAATVKMVETDELKSIIARHQEMVGSKEFVADHQYPMLQQRGKASYAQATVRQFESDPPTIEESSSEDSRLTSFAAPDLEHVHLQTCTIPSSNVPVSGLIPAPRSTSVTGSQAMSSPVSTVLDTYLDNIMANVPQLALCLQDQGFVQSVKLLDTEQIPSTMLQPKTADPTVPFESIRAGPGTEQIFSPDIMKMNAATLLRFLKANCTTDNSTYLLHRPAGRTNVQLYDISSISTQRQQKWNWWLAMMSNRFANRLRSLAVNTTDRALRRKFRARQRGLLQTTLDLLEAVSDMNGKAHESLVAAISESLADTFLAHEDDEAVDSDGSPHAAAAISISSKQPYAKISGDALKKAQDYLVEGIRVLQPSLDRCQSRMKRTRKKQSSQPSPSRVVVKSVSVDGDDSGDDSSDESTGSVDIASVQMEASAVASQLFSLHHKLVTVSLRLAEVYMGNYGSSSTMQSLRSAAQKASRSFHLAQLASYDSSRRTEKWLSRLNTLYTWIWEHCGHFARSFAADENWRERGHLSGEDVISVLREVDSALRERPGENQTGEAVSFSMIGKDSLEEKSMGVVSFQSLSGIIGFQVTSEKKKDNSWFDDEVIDVAEHILGTQHVLQREHRRVLVVACVCYGRSIDSLQQTIASTAPELRDEVDNPLLLSLLRQRFGDACNETGNALMDAVRQLLVSFPANDDMTSDEDTEMHKAAADPLLSSAQFWFLEGLAVFSTCRDLRNVALLRCNLCQCCKLRANSVFAKSDDKSAVDHAEVCLSDAARHLQDAHEALGQRDVDPSTWDMVSGELAATFLVLGVRRRQSLIGSGNVPMILQALRLSPGRERSIVDPMQRALDIYVQSGNGHQAAAAHYQLALFYSKIWTCQRDETKTREKLASAFSHYNVAHAYFSRAVKGNEPTFCLLCLDLSNLYSTVSGEECLAKAMHRCLDTTQALSPESVDGARQRLLGPKLNEWMEKMATLADTVEDRCVKILRSLIKHEEEGKTTKKKGYYKDLYRAVLKIKMTTAGSKDNCEFSSRIVAIHGLLLTIQKQQEVESKA